MFVRFYEKEFPDEGEVVAARITEITDQHALCELIEYGKEGMIIHSEVSRKRIKTIKNLLRVGKIEFVSVLRVDKQKGYIDLSKKNVTSEEIVQADTRLAMAKNVRLVVNKFCEDTSSDMLSIYEKYIWPMKNVYGDEYTGFKKIGASLEVNEKDLPAKLIEGIKAKFKPKEVKVRADINVSYIGYEGVDVIKEALIAGQMVSPEANLKYRTIAIKSTIIYPEYSVYMIGIDENECLKKVQACIDKTKEFIESKGGYFNVVVKPIVISKQSELILNKSKLENDSDDEQGEHSEHDE